MPSPVPAPMTRRTPSGDGAGACSTVKSERGNASMPAAAASRSLTSVTGAPPSAAAIASASRTQSRLVNRAQRPWIGPATPKHAAAISVRCDRSPGKESVDRGVERGKAWHRPGGPRGSSRSRRRYASRSRAARWSRRRRRPGSTCARLPSNVPAQWSPPGDGRGLYQPARPATAWASTGPQVPPR